MIEKLSWVEINNFLLNGTNKVRLVLPSIHEEWAMLIGKVVEGGLHDIKVSINNSEKYIRDGYGDGKAIVQLKNLEVEIVETANNRISVISVDDFHFLYFP